MVNKQARTEPNKTSGREAGRKIIKKVNRKPATTAGSKEARWPDSKETSK